MLSGKAWESNPPQPALRHLPLILKTRASTGTHPFPSVILPATAGTRNYTILPTDRSSGQNTSGEQLQITIHEPLQYSLPAPKQGRCRYHRATLQKKLPAQSVERFLCVEILKVIAAEHIYL